jgi:hypothetical protein
MKRLEQKIKLVPCTIHLENKLTNEIYKEVIYVEDASVVESIGEYEGYEIVRYEI